MEKFNALVVDQFNYGGKKYAATSKKESTDMLFDAYGKNWLFGTMDKYTYRYTNLARERDILKIATYCYLLWLKRGFHLLEEGINDPVINTTVDVKVKEFDKFKMRVSVKADEWVRQYDWSTKVIENETVKEVKKFPDTELISSISTMLKNLAKKEWKELPEIALFSMFVLCYILWSRNFKEKAGQDTDTYNETKV